MKIVVIGKKEDGSKEIIAEGRYSAVRAHMTRGHESHIGYAEVYWMRDYPEGKRISYADESVEDYRERKDIPGLEKKRAAALKKIKARRNAARKAKDAEAKTAEPAKTEPAKTEPAKTGEPVKTTEPAKTEPAKTEPAKTGEPAKDSPSA